MLQKLITWIDSFDDYVNPLIVREMRRLSKTYEMFFFISFWLTVYSIIFFAAFFNDVSTNILLEVFSVICGIIWIIAILSGFLNYQSIIENTRRDETLFLTGLSSRQHLHGYWGMSILWSLFFISFSIPSLIGLVLITNSHYLFLIPLEVFLSSQCITLFCLSILAQSTSAGIKHVFTAKESFLSVIVFIFSMVCFQFPFIIISFPQLNVLSYFKEFGFFSIFVQLPIAQIIIAMVAYKLSLRGFKTNYRPRFKEIFYNCGVYFLTNIILTAIHVIILLTLF
ncbi:MAG: hypothetical protein LBC74_03245 [Planctomycetaceae bacterium]|jgi:hypothetical protein|nr:hypothetical protein [Planctomycetaceae bacterium]